MNKKYFDIEAWSLEQWKKTLHKAQILCKTGNYVDEETGEILTLKRHPVQYDGLNNHDKYMKRKFGEWVNRLGFEKQGRLGHFVTLTYNEWNYPDEQRIDHLQKFVKRIRRYMKYHNIPTSDGLPLRYFFSTERGKKHDRLHYHAIIFGLPRIIVHKLNNGKWEPNARNIWNYGFASARLLVNEKIAYVCKYIFKQWDGNEYKTLKNGNIGLSLMDERNKDLVTYFRKNVVDTIHSGLKYPFRLTRSLRELVFQRKSHDKRIDLLQPFCEYLKVSPIVGTLWQKYKDKYCVYPEADGDDCTGYIRVGQDSNFELVREIPESFYNSLI